MRAGRRRVRTQDGHWMNRTELLVDLALGPGVRAAYSTRAGGVSQGGYASLNLGSHVGDAPAAVAENRARVAAAFGAPPLYLNQVHGCRVARPAPGDAVPEADAALSLRPEAPLAILVADCLPVLFVARDAAGQARAVAAAHAGWRGLAAGVLEASLQALRDAVPAAEVSAWLGPCIGAAAFEVGEDVLRGFGRSAAQPGGHFRWQPRADGSPAWRADLRGLARERLQAAGVVQIQAETDCTVSEPSRFFSFRRDGAVSGRFGAFIGLA
jgi:YfiH family protein